VIFEDLGMEKLGYFMVIWSILQPFGIFLAIW
jgi:hypothetical protein